MAKELTDRSVGEARPRAKDYYLREASRARGVGRLEVRIRPGGAKIAYYRYTADDGKRVRLPIGNVGAGGMTIAEARDEARRHATTHRAPESRDVRAAIRSKEESANAAKAEAARIERERQTRAEAETKNTLDALLTVYADNLEKQKKQSAGNVRSIFRLHVTKAMPDIATKVAAEVTSRDATALLRKLTDAGHGRTAAKLRSFARAAYALAMRAELDPDAPADLLRFGIQANPFAATGTLSAHSRALDRVLTVTELRAYWKALDKLPDIKRDALKLHLLLGGQRPAQLTRVELVDVDRAAGTIVLRDGKGARKQPRLHVLPLTSAALTIAKALIKRAQLLESSWLFSTYGKSQLRGETLTNAAAEVRDAMLTAKTAKARFDLRDLRRTAETEMAALGISKEVRAQIQSHGLGGVQDRHYDRHKYMAEKRSALEAWSKHLNVAQSGQVAETYSGRKRRKKGPAK